MPDAPTPLACASRENSCFQVSKPAAELPQVAAWAEWVTQTSVVRIAMAADIFLPLVIRNSLAYAESRCPLARSHAARCRLRRVVQHRQECVSSPPQRIRAAALWHGRQRRVKRHALPRAWLR